MVVEQQNDHLDASPLAGDVQRRYTVLPCTQHRHSVLSHYSIGIGILYKYQLSLIDPRDGIVP